MKYDLVHPCAHCPFTRNARAVRLTPARAQEVGACDGEFPCHETIDYEVRRPNEEQHCVGALLFAHKLMRPHQMARICERLGILDMAALVARNDLNAIIDEVAEMMAR